MQLPDLVNSFFQIGSGFFILNNCRVLLIHKSVRGVSISTTLFFATWAMYNIWFYNSLNQPISFYSSFLVVIADIIWISLALHYKKHPGGKLVVI